MNSSKYEHYEELSQISGTGEPKADDEGKVWLTRRRRDGKIFLAREYNDPLNTIAEIKDSIKAILNHPSIINLIDIIPEHTDHGGRSDFMVWEICEKGTLANLLETRRRDALQKSPLPESLCWHVLDGISRALLFLHQGRKITYPLDREMLHDEDWQPIFITDLRPEKIHFCAPRGGQMYGNVKLGGFESAAIGIRPKMLMPYRLGKFTAYTPPEVRRGGPWSTKAEIFCLGAIVYHMMKGEPPVQLDMSNVLEVRSDSFHINELPKTYSTELKDLVYAALCGNKDARPGAGELTHQTGANLSFWASKSAEGRRYEMMQNLAGL